MLSLAFMYRQLGCNRSERTSQLFMHAVWPTKCTFFSLSFEFIKLEVDVEQYTLLNWGGSRKLQTVNLTLNYCFVRVVYGVGTNSN